MRGQRKTASDCDPFCDEYIISRKSEIHSKEQYAFLLGYYAHLITDAEFQRYIRDEQRVADAWTRIKADVHLYEQAKGYPEDWDAVKRLISKETRMKEIHAIEAEYLQENSDSGYLTEILPLKEFPDYIDYLPKGCIVRKIGVMGYIPKIEEGFTNPIAMTREEYNFFVQNAVALVIDKFKEKKLV